ncbi:hypothetical protein N7472_008389 [Penicillium cf. griseofulvum]|uniref:Uncharacterized protein n=1 Tax=Penicillium cf. griseofulvum TaxID=2972120 RepID=A0A9W9J6U9_9EURO|nr:hypothetical protein N7472_008389 [Penicillium cf. griseofulvum]
MKTKTKTLGPIPGNERYHPTLGGKYLGKYAYPNKTAENSKAVPGAFPAEELPLLPNTPPHEPKSDTDPSQGVDIGNQEDHLAGDQAQEINSSVDEVVRAEHEEMTITPTRLRSR